MATTTGVHLQRETEVFFSPVNVQDTGVTHTSFTPTNMKELEVLAGFTLNYSANNEDIEKDETGLEVDRSVQRFITSYNPVDWSFQCYMTLNGSTTPSAANAAPSTGGTQTGFVTPVEDWFMWQMLISNTQPMSSSTNEDSVFRTNGTIETKPTTGATGMSPSISNYKNPPKGVLYLKQEDAIFMVPDVTVDTAAVEVGTSGIATTTWSGFGTSIIELEGAQKDSITRVIGGTLANGTTVDPSANSTNAYVTASYKPFGTSNVGGVQVEGERIQQRLSTVSINYEDSSGTTKSYPDQAVRGFTLTYGNSITSDVPESLGKLNDPLPGVRGAKNISGDMTMYFRKSDGTNKGTAELVRDIIGGQSTSTSDKGNFVCTVGDTAGTRVQFTVAAPQFGVPSLNFDTITETTLDYLAQETTRGSSDELKVQFTKV